MQTTEDKIEEIQIEDINLEASPVVRVRVDEPTVHEYSLRYEKGIKALPPIMLYDAPDVDGLLLADGAHRVRGALKAGHATILGVVRKGDWKDAMSYALLANAQHGLPRTNEDKRLCVRAALELWPDRSNAFVANACDVDDKTVASVRREMEGDGEIEASETRISATGKRVSATRAARKSEPAPVELKDTHGQIIPVSVQKYWERSNEPKDMMRGIKQLMDRLEAIKGEKDVMFAELNFTGILADLDRVRRSLSCAIPYAVCTQCQGHPESQKGGCRLCLGRGLISEFRWRAVPEEIRNMRTSKKNEVQA